VQGLTSSTPADPTFLMSDRLNDDVLLLVLDRLADPHRDISTVSPKRQALLQVCLASRRLCRLAQPILWRHFVLRSLDQVAALEEGRISYFLYSSPSVVTISTSNELLPEEGLAALDLFPNLVEVRVLGQGEWTSLELLARLKGPLFQALVDEPWSSADSPSLCRPAPPSTAQNPRRASFDLAFAPSARGARAQKLRHDALRPPSLAPTLAPAPPQDARPPDPPARPGVGVGRRVPARPGPLPRRAPDPHVHPGARRPAEHGRQPRARHGTAPLVLFANPLGASSLPRHSVVRPWLYEARETVLKELIKAAWGTPRRTYRGELPFVLFMPDLVAGPPCAERARRVEPDLDELERACKERGVCLVRYKALRAARAAERLEPPVEVERYVRQLRAAQRRK